MEQRTGGTNMEGQLGVQLGSEAVVNWEEIYQMLGLGYGMPFMSFLRS